MTAAAGNSNRKAGVCYAMTQDGVELPVVDVTHPAFSLSICETRQRELVETFLREGDPLARLPGPLRRLVLRLLLRGSVLAQGIRQAQGGFMSGMNTYRLKLGPEMLGPTAHPVDRRITAGLPAMAMRLRLQDIARLMADVLTPALAEKPTRPLYFLNIAGGPAMDSLNTLILFRKESPALVEGRKVFIDVLDLDEVGPAFGQAALASLSAEPGPLHGLQIAFRARRYDWTRSTDVEKVLQEARSENGIVIASSEGGLFEYGSDDEITSNLTALRDFAEVLAVVGSVTRADEPVQRLRQISAAAAIPRGLPVFSRLVEPTGWKVMRVIERPFSDDVVLT